jgi:hypothetical protein
LRNSQTEETYLVFYQGLEIEKDIGILILIEIFI